MQGSTHYCFEMAIFSIFYEFDAKTGNLKKAKLAFYPSPIDCRNSLDDLNEAAEFAFDHNEELYNHLDNWISLLEIKTIFQQIHLKLDLIMIVRLLHMRKHICSLVV